MILKFLLGLILLSTPSTTEQLGRDGYIVIPSIDLSAIRQVICPKAGAMGTGFLIGDHILATADHVARVSPCYDGQTGAALTVYKEDPKHDFALMTSPRLPINIPYIKYSCQAFHTGEQYFSYGITPYNLDVSILRMNSLTATSELTEEGDVTEFPYSGGMTVLNGAIAPGTSGGPVFNKYGYAIAVNNAGNEEVTLEYTLKDSILCQSPNGANFSANTSRETM